LNKRTFNIVASGLLIALSVVLTRVFSANFMIVGVPAGRLAVGFVPIVLAGMMLGPYFGMGVGAVADVLGYLLFPSGVYFFGITITSALAGLIPFIVMRLTGKMRYWVQALLAVAVTQILCSMFLQTFWLSVLYGKAYEALFYPRAIVALITIPVYFILIYAILTGLKRAKLLPEQR
jgi:riboflavin transporter